jgi:hypothetical protein
MSIAKDALKCLKAIFIILRPKDSYFSPRKLTESFFQTFQTFLKEKRNSS